MDDVKSRMERRKEELEPKEPVRGPFGSMMPEIRRLDPSIFDIPAPTTGRGLGEIRNHIDSMVVQLRVPELQEAWNSWDELCDKGIDISSYDSDASLQSFSDWLIAEDAAWEAFNVRLGEHRDEFYPKAER